MLRTRTFVLALLLLLPASASRAQQANLGHKVLGAIGLRAGAQAAPGLYVADRLVWYGATTLKDKNGDSLPVGLNMDAFGNALGVSAVFPVPLSALLSVSLSVPASRVRLNTERPEASLDRHGFGDFYVQPLKLGWRQPRWDLVTGYAFYAPTGKFEPGGTEGVGRGHWSHELSLGGALWLDQARSWNLSALASFELNAKKRGIDITRGDTVQIQGGLGKEFFHALEIGVTGYAMTQVSDNSGSDVPPPLLDARDSVFGLGAEAGLVIPAIRGRVTLRYAHDVTAKARPLAQLVVVGLTIVAWRPKPRAHSNHADGP